MKCRIAAVLISTAFLSIPSMASDPIPPELTGIWESEDSVFNDRHALFEGQGVYLRQDGKGMLIGGPPPIGVLFISRYDEEKNALLLRAFNGEVPGECFDGVLTYDPIAETLDIGVKLRRRIAGMPLDWEEYLERRPIPCSW